MAADLKCDGSGNIAVLDIVDTINKNKKAFENKVFLEQFNGILPDGTDLNNIHKSGVYALPQHGVNKPNAIKVVHAAMTVFQAYNSVYVQTIYSLDGKHVWKRVATGNPTVWSNWEQALFGTWDGTTLDITI